MSKRVKAIEHKRFKINPAVFFLLPYLLLFVTFIIVPTTLAVLLSFTNYNSVEFPDFVGLMNYINLLTRDEIFMQYVLPNTIFFSFIVGPVGYCLSFVLAWMLAQIQKIPRTVLALIIYSPSLTSGVAMAVVWKILFAGDRMGYINSFLLQMNLITEPLQFLKASSLILPIMIIVSLWSSMGVGFLAMLAGVLNIDESVYEAARIDGMRNRFQEMFYITIPMMKPQMLFGAVMAVVNTFQVGAIGVQLTGVNPTPGYAGQLMVNHIEDYGFIRFEMGYASAVSVFLLVLIYFISKAARRLFRED